MLTYFARTLGALLESGIPLENGLAITQNTIQNSLYKKTLTKVQNELKTGKNLSASLIKYPKYFPLTYVKLIEIGESTGTLEENLDYLYELYSEEVTDMTNNFATVIEPLLLIFIGLMIGSLALIIIAPIYQLTGSINA
jgi:type IV pilus assembly protein PilC